MTLERDEYEQRHLHDIAVELSEYRAALRAGYLLRALSCLNYANELGKALAEHAIERGVRT